MSKDLNQHWKHMEINVNTALKANVKKGAKFKFQKNNFN